LAEKCEVQVAYAIGLAEPISIMVETFGTDKMPEEQIEAMVRKNFDMRPAGIIRTLDLKRPIYQQTAAYGHFGRNNPSFTWEKTNRQIF
jgi:S-adenosylmethionine synthetase